MAKKGRFGPQDRDGNGFVALPHQVLESRAYLGLSVHAKVLLFDIALQLRGCNNGALLCSRRHMSERGWNSSDMLSKSKAELLKAGFIFETVKGQRPNKAGWYAVTWRALDRLDGMDVGARECFVRSAYKAITLPPPKPTRQELIDRWQEPEKTQAFVRPTVQEAPP